MWISSPGTSVPGRGAGPLLIQSPVAPGCLPVVSKPHRLLRIHPVPRSRNPWKRPHRTIRVPSPAPAASGGSFVVSLHGSQQISCVDMQDGALREHVFRLSHPFPGGVIILCKGVRLDQADPLLQVVASCFHQGKECINGFLIPSDLPEEVSFLPPGRPVDFRFFCRAFLDYPVKYFFCFITLSILIVSRCQIIIGIKIKIIYKFITVR